MSLYTTYLSKKVRLALGLSLPVLALTGGISSAAHAQEEQADKDKIEKISVTGSRIKRAELTAPTPVTTFTAEDIENTGKTNIEDIVSTTPALVGSSGNTDTGGGLVGANFLNLRNLGEARTLVLINGRRHVAANELGSAAVDTSSIPVDLIERVEITTGGASAVYGADGVSGVVNFILKDDFEGTNVKLQGGLSGESDAEDLYFSFLTGNNFADGDGNVTLAYEYNKRGGLRAKDRDFLSTDTQWFVNNPNGGAPARVLSGDIRDTFVAADGLIDPFNLFSGGFRGNDPLDRGNHVGAPGAGVPSGTIGGNSTEMWRIIRWGVFPDTDKHTFNLMSNYDFSDDTRGFAEFKYAKVAANSYSQSSYMILNRAMADNPFLPENVAAAAAVVGAGTPSGPPIMYSRFDIDTGGKYNERETDTLRLVLGLEGDLSDNLAYEVSFNHGQSKVTRTESLRYDDRYFAAVDVVIDPATGQATCRSNLDPAAFANTPVGVVTTFNPANGAQSFTPGANSGCVPLNPFVDDGAANAAAYDWVFFRDNTKGKLTQTVLSGYLSGDTSSWDFELQGGAISYVLGAEYRKEKAEVDFPTSRESGPVFRYDAGVKDQSGDFDVKEVFTEVSLPIFYDAGTMLNELTLNAALRLSDYSTIGNATTWELGLMWSPIEEVRLRTTLSQAIRAPNINELYSPLQPAAFLPVDPCSIENQQFGVNRAANCAAALGALGLDNNLTLPSTAVNFPGTNGGNPDLQQEEADTFTIGAVFEPSFAEGLSFAVDYYNIEIANGIILPSAQSIVDSCYDAPSLDNPFCARLGRAANGDLNSLSVSYVNVASFKTSGYDFSARYNIDMQEAGQLDLSFNGGVLEKLDIQSTTEPVFDDEKGEAGTILGNNAPKFILNFNAVWSYENLAIQYGFNHHDKLLRIENEVADNAAELQNPYLTDALWDHNVRVSYAINDTAQVFFGVNNLTDEKPAPNSSALPISPVGRFFYAGINMQFDSLF